MKNIHLASVFIALSLSTVGCTHAASVNIANPLVAGQVAENEIRFPDRSTEMKYALPAGTLVHEATLKSLDDKQICFDVTLRAEGQRKDLASPKGWRVFLRGKPSFEDMSPQVTSVTEVKEETVQGSKVHLQKQNQHICDNTGYCYDKEITTSSREAADIKVLTGGGTVCFANKGNISKTTEEVTLHFDDPNPTASSDGETATPTIGWGGGALMNRVAFRWKFN